MREGDENESESGRERVDHSHSESARKCFNKQQIECDIEEMRMLVSNGIRNLQKSRSDYCTIIMIIM